MLLWCRGRRCQRQQEHVIILHNQAAFTIKSLTAGAMSESTLCLFFVIQVGGVADCSMHQANLVFCHAGGEWRTSKQNAMLRAFRIGLEGRQLLGSSGLFDPQYILVISDTTFGSIIRLNRFPQRFKIYAFNQISFGICNFNPFAGMSVCVCELYCLCRHR